MAKQSKLQKPLKNINKSRHLKRGYEMLDELIRIHREIEKEIDFSIQDKRLAIYLILGGMITNEARSLYWLGIGNMENHAQLQRLLAESMDLVIFFCETEETSRQVKQWFNGRIISRQPGNAGNLTLTQRARFFDTEEQTIKNMDETVKIANEVLSPYMHPSYELVTATFDDKKNSFRYYSQRQKVMSQEEMKGKSRLGLSSILTAFGMSLATIFLLDTAEHLKTIAAYMKEIYPEAYV